MKYEELKSIKYETMSNLPGLEEMSFVAADEHVKQFASACIQAMSESAIKESMKDEE